MLPPAGGIQDGAIETIVGGTGSDARISCSENTSLGVVCLHCVTNLLVNKKRRGLTITVVLWFE